MSREHFGSMLLGAMYPPSMPRCQCGRPLAKTLIIRTDSGPLQRTFCGTQECAYDIAHATMTGMAGDEP